jgi:hypothetical protein
MEVSEMLALLVSFVVGVIALAAAAVAEEQKSKFSLFASIAFLIVALLGARYL